MFTQLWPYIIILFLVEAAIINATIHVFTTTVVHISDESWQRWERFKVETCRQQLEENTIYGTSTADQQLNSTEHAYFHWEQGEFHRHLRQRLLPETGRGNFRPIIHLLPQLSRLDPRLFMSEPKSLCKAATVKKATELEEQRRTAKEEFAQFEDSIIDRVFPYLPDAYEDY